ncbi:MAG: PIG-L family deacetylase, partial [Saprospiraceae bacterium]|nr:PIG-L family deacetylase [Saprospiraceae bacterium]
MNRLLLPLSLLFFFFAPLSDAHSQQPPRWTSGELHEAIEKLNFLGSALYVAAHPDDENTALIAYLANDLKARSAYLSMTRGDGGQNLAGPEIRELLGLIRTQELLAARRIDGGIQRFTRANDFGYSKHSDETLEIWNKEAVLSDVVWAIRNLRPDIIVNRFDHESAGRTHGHHTASAILSYEAFDLAGDPDAFPEQLQYVEPWQPTRLYYNTSWWAYGSREAFEKIDKSDMAAVDVGVYYPLMGKSNTELSAQSRSMHKSQGFGAYLSRGRDMEYLKILKGNLPEDKNDLFGGINTTWERVPGGAPISALLSEAAREFNFEDPAASVPKLLEVQRMIDRLPDGYWKSVKAKEINRVIQGCLGLYAEAVSSNRTATPGEEVPLALEVVNRSAVEVKLNSMTVLPAGTRINFEAAVLENNRPFTLDTLASLPSEMDYTTPYWLRHPWELGMYQVENQQSIGLPEKD